MSPPILAAGGELPTGIYPFWFWNGDLEEEELRWQIGQMADGGLKGFFIHPRQGLRQPYLSEGFFALVAVAIDEAEKRGLVVHLYDEYPYPSGVAGGEVTLGNPQYCGTRLIQENFEVAGGPLRQSLPRGEVLCCIAYPLKDDQPEWGRGLDLLAHVGMVLTDHSYTQTGLTQYNRKRYFASNPTPVLEAELPSGPHRVFVAVQALVETHKYWGHFVDVLNPEAVQRFISLTHERYRRRFGAKFGKSIHSIFVDETQPGWSALLPGAFRERYGYDLPPLLPALQETSHPQHLRVAADLGRLKYELFCATFEEPIRSWCARNHLRYSGEKTSLRLAQLRYMDLPGCDPGHTKAGVVPDILRATIRSNARAVASAAYFYGKEGSLCECYHSMGWSGTLQDAKLVAEGLLLMGIRYLVPHGFFYTTHALAKHDAPPSFFFQMPYWPHFRALTRHLDLIAHHFEGTWIDAEILVVDPHGGLPTRDDLQAYERLLHRLMSDHLDFLIVDTDILEAAAISGGRARPQDLAASVVIVPPMQVIESDLRNWLETFGEAGGIVLHCADGQMPALPPSVSSHLPLRSLGGDLDRVWMVTRADANRRLYFLLNTGSETVEIACTPDAPVREIPLERPVSPRQISPRQISLRQISLRQDADSYRLTLHPFDSLLLESIAAPISIDPPATIEIGVPVAVQVTPLNANLLRLYTWKMALLDDNGGVLQEAEVPAIPLANQLAHGGFRFAPRIQPGFGTMPSLDPAPLSLRYRCDFESAYSGAVELVVEPGSIAGEWRLDFNGAEFGPEDLGPTNAHVRGSQSLDLAAHLRQGTNSLNLYVRTDRLDGGLLNPLYLAGDFGVAGVAPPRLVDRAPAGRFEAWEENGLPYYAGAVEYTADIVLGELPGGGELLVTLTFPLPFQEAAEVAFNGGPWHPVLWSPYRALISTSEVREGVNSLALRVYTTLIRSFEGQYFDIENHKYCEVGT